MGNEGDRLQSRILALNRNVPAGGTAIIRMGYIPVILCLFSLFWVNIFKDFLCHISGKKLKNIQISSMKKWMVLQKLQ